MLKLLFKKALDRPYMETVIIPADRSSPDLVSYRAVQNWRGSWSIRFCNYVHPRKVNKNNKLTKVLIQESPFFLALDTVKTVKNLTKEQTIAHLKQLEKGFRVYQGDSIYESLRHFTAFQTQKNDKITLKQ